MEDRIELLDIELLNDKEKLREIDYWLKVLNWPNSWHFTYSALSKWFNIREDNSFNFKYAIQRIKSSKLLETRMRLITDII